MNKTLTYINLGINMSAYEHTGSLVQLTTHIRLEPTSLGDACGGSSPTGLRGGRLGPGLPRGPACPACSGGRLGPRLPRGAAWSPARKRDEY